MGATLLKMAERQQLAAVFSVQRFQPHTSVFVARNSSQKLNTGHWYFLLCTPVDDRSARARSQQRMCYGAAVFCPSPQRQHFFWSLLRGHICDSQLFCMFI
jgi:hypothetical protein